jgi:hypothetical protein
MNPDDIKTTEEESTWRQHAHEGYSEPPWEARQKAAATWKKYAVRTVEDNAESEKIFYNSIDAQAYSEQQLKVGKCAYVVEVEVDDDDIPF